MVLGIGQPYKRISFDKFCAEFMKVLDENVNAEKEKQRLLEERIRKLQEEDSELSSIPDQKAKEETENMKEAEIHLQQVCLEHEQSKLPSIDLKLIDDEDIFQSYSPSVHPVMVRSDPEFQFNYKTGSITHFNNIIYLKGSLESIINKISKDSFFEKAKPMIRIVVYAITLGIHLAFQL